MDKIRTSVPGLPEGWVKEVVVRKSGASAGKSDVYYYSPDGKKCRSKPQMLQYLPEDFDIENFDFRAGANAESILKKRKRRKDDFNFGKDFGMAGNDVKPTRQTKKARESINVCIINNKDVEGEKMENAVARKKTTSRVDTETKKRRAENLSQRFSSKPRQLFWQSRLQHLKARNEKSRKPCKTSQLDTFIRNLLPGSNNESLLNSVWHSLFMSNKVTGQHASLNALRKHPTALCNIDQPFTAPFTITEDMIHEQEKKVEVARKKLCEAQELLRALEDEEEEYDDTED